MPVTIAANPAARATQAVSGTWRQVLMSGLVSTVQGFRVLGLGFRVLGFRVLGLGFRVLGFRVLGFRVLGF